MAGVSRRAARAMRMAVMIAGIRCMTAAVFVVVRQQRGEESVLTSLVAMAVVGVSSISCVVDMRYRRAARVRGARRAELRIGEKIAEIVGDRKVGEGIGVVLLGGCGAQGRDRGDETGRTDRRGGASPARFRAAIGKIFRLRVFGHGASLMEPPVWRADIATPRACSRAFA